MFLIFVARTNHENRMKIFRSTVHVKPLHKSTVKNSTNKFVGTICTATQEKWFPVFIVATVAVAFNFVTDTRGYIPALICNTVLHFRMMY